MYDLVILGGGPAGYLAAERAAAGGFSTLLFEKRELGGVCLNEGCIPSKALLHSAKVYETALHSKDYGVTVERASIDQKAVVARRGRVVKTLVGGVAAKMRNAKVNVVKREATIEGRVSGGYSVKDADGERYEAQRILIATGSSPVIPPIPGVKEGLERGFVLTNREILTLDAVPEKLVIIGGGVIGLEMAAYYRAVHADVTVIEMLDHIAGPTDLEIGRYLMAEYEKKGVKFLLNTKVTGVEDGAVIAETGANTVKIPADKVLLSIGRRANAQNLGLNDLLISRAGVVVDDRMRTNVENVYAAGDVTGLNMLAHTAYRESEVAVNTMLGKRDRIRYNANPSVIYTKPEVACVGFSEESATAEGIEYEMQRLSMRHSGRFIAENAGGDGLCKVLVGKAHRNIIGVHMVGAYASEIIWGAAEMIELELRVKDAREIIFPHPTVSEIIREVLWTFTD